MTETSYDRSDDNLIESLLSDESPVSRYDISLLLIPIAYAIGLLAGTVSSLSIVQTIVPPSVVGLIVIYDVCYVHPPSE